MNRKEYLKTYKQEYKNRVKQVQLTLSPDEYRYFKTIADKEKIKVTSLIKTMALAQVGKTFYNPKETQTKLDEFVFIMRNIANNINQMARLSNTLKAVTEENKVLSYLRDLENKVKDFISKGGV